MISKYIKDIESIVTKENTVSGLGLLGIAHIDRLAVAFKEEKGLSNIGNSVIPTVSKIQRAKISNPDYSYPQTIEGTDRYITGLISLYSLMRVKQLKHGRNTSRSDYADLMFNTYKLCLLLKLNVCSPTQVNKIKDLVEQMEETSQRYTVGLKAEARKLSITYLTQELSNLVQQEQEYYYNGKFNSITRTLAKQLTLTDVPQLI